MDANTGEPGAGIAVDGVIYLVYALAIIIPSIAVSIRRLHDGNYSGWLYLIILVPFVGGLALLVFMLPLDWQDLLRERAHSMSRRVFV